MKCLPMANLCRLIDVSYTRVEVNNLSYEINIRIRSAATVYTTRIIVKREHRINTFE